MSIELFWLTLTVVMTALFWIPYILDRIAVRGLMGAMATPAPADRPQSAWAQRAMRAHENAVENLVVFAPLVLVLHALGISSGLTAGAAALYFFARLAHFFIYVAGIPIARTLAFAVGWAAQMAIALRILGIL
jgi:uncharacterized MAPEG superfamily protein